jgi:hypothetical protein
VPGEETEQPKLFPESHEDARGKPKVDTTRVQPSDFGSTEKVAGLKFVASVPLPAFSPLANMGLTELCGFCGREVRPPGCVIPDYEELGAFCNQDCADRRFRTYLEETSE